MILTRSKKRIAIFAATLICVITALLIVRLAPPLDHRVENESEINSPSFDRNDQIGLRVPEGYVIQRVAGEPEIAFPTFATFDDKGRLFVVEVSGRDYQQLINQQMTESRITLLEDRDNDGRFEHAMVYADKLVFPMGLAYRDGKLYVADQPHLLVLEDKDNDGRAESRQVLIEGFGPSDNGGLHGLTFGPDGMLYMTVGRLHGMGKNAYQLHGDDGASIMGKSGALLRCAPDGSHQEVVCRGFIQLVEFDFMPEGEIVSPVQIWYGMRHSPGRVEALAHLVEGALYPDQPDDGTPQLVTNVALPPIASYPEVMSSGVTRYRGSVFPLKGNRNLFSARYNEGKVVLHHLMRDGSTFRTQDTPFVVPATDERIFLPTEVLESADGSLLVIDTGGWYTGCGPPPDLTRRGGIYRVRYKGREAPLDPWGLQIDWPRAQADQLIEYLSDERPAVRIRAQHTLVERGTSAIGALAKVLNSSEKIVAKRYAIWALAAIGDPTALVPIRKLLTCDDEEMLTLAARALASHSDRSVASQLSSLLGHKIPHVRFAVAEALARCGTTLSLPAIYSALSSKPDPFLKHALMHAVYRIAGKKELEEGMRDSRSPVARTALRLLSQPPHDGVTQKILLEFNGSADTEMQQDLYEILLDHPQWDTAAIAILGELLNHPTHDDQDCLRLARLVTVFESHKPVQDLVAEVVQGPGKKWSQRSRIELLRAMAHSKQLHVPVPWSEAIKRRALKDTSEPIRVEATRTAAALRISSLSEMLRGIVQNKNLSSDQRVEALRATVSPNTDLSDQGFELLLSELAVTDDPVMRMNAAEILASTRITPSQVPRLFKVVRDDPLITPAILWPMLCQSVNVETTDAILDYIKSSLQGGQFLDESEFSRLVEAVGQHRSDWASRVDALQKRLRGKSKKQRSIWDEHLQLLTGGNVARGREIFFSTRIACSACHHVGGEGGAIGPDLTKIAQIRTGSELLSSILFPSRSIVDEYALYTILTSTGRVLSGCLEEVSRHAILLRRLDGNVIQINKEEIVEAKASKTSIMPDALLNSLTKIEIRDLLAFLKSLR